jgi:hypothetical protein
MPKHGKQTPTYHFCAPYSASEGSLATELHNGYSPYTLHLWQEYVLDDWLALKDNGKPLNNVCLLPVPRQNGKTGVSDPRCTWGLIKRGENILYTAQEYQTAKKAFDRMREKFGRKRDDPFAQYPELNALVDHYTTSANQMVLSLINGGYIEFRTRGSSSGVGRGNTCDVLIIDEAQDYTEEQDSALSSLVSAAPHGSPQTIYMGTVPEPGKGKGTVFTRLRRQLHEDPQPGECISEWAAPEIGDVTDEDRWYEFNPSLGYQLLPEALRAESRSMLPDRFAREHLGWWPPETGKLEPAISDEDWQECGIDDAPEGDGDAFGVKFSADGKNVSVSSCIKLGDGSVYVELVASRSTSQGVRWLLNAIHEVPHAVWAIDGKSGAHALVQRALRMDDIVPENIIEVSTPNAISAATTFLDAVREKRVSWCRGVGDVLTDSVQNSPRRKIGNNGGWGFGGDNPTPVESAALAAWAAFNAETEEEELEVFF